MSETITDAVKSKYGSVAASGLSTDHDGVKAVAEAFGYSPEELASIPAEANMGPLLREPDRNRRPPGGRDSRGPGQRRRPGRVPGGPKGRAGPAGRSAST